MSECGSEPGTERARSNAIADLYVCGRFIFQRDARMTGLGNTVGEGDSATVNGITSDCIRLCFCDPSGHIVMDTIMCSPV